MGPTMDNQLIRELFTNTAAAAELLYPETEEAAEQASSATAEQAFADKLREAITKLPPHQISKDGYLMEWMEDYKEAEPQHRHVSHLYGLYPGNQISPTLTPELAEACRVTLNRRGDEATGWSRAWKINFWARLGDGNRALKLLGSLLAPAAYEGCTEEFHNVAGTYPNMLCAHPPFQIDGNFGGAAGISEMLVQSNEGFINILPALPSEWSEGRIRGLKVRGGAIIDLEWSEGKATEITITGGWKEDIRLYMQNDLWLEFNLAKGHKKHIRFD
jgi:alpha-L-fucosidase 2